MPIVNGIEPSLALTLAPLIEQRQALKAQAAALEHDIDAINDAIKTALVNSGELEVSAAGHKVTLNMEAEKSSLDKRLLLQNGVTTEQIQKSTKITTYMKLDVRAVKESE